jgi:CDP-paratose 2-epimerase
MKKVLIKECTQNKELTHRRTAPRRRRQYPSPRKTEVLITGGAGFVGANLAARLAETGHNVLVFDNLSRPGVEENLILLRGRFGERISVEIADIRDPEAVGRAVTRASEVFHFAAQVAVTTSVSHPVEDFEINARGTLNLLEALRRLPSAPPLLYTSTNKVYGKLEGHLFEEEEKAFRPISAQLAERGVPESQPLDFYSPYGCSKGTAEQYVRDYARIYGLPTVVFRMSCIYGPLQKGTEDQGWVAHFLIRALRNEPITLYGNGKQVRDILFIDDLLDAFVLAKDQMPKIRGEVFNIGGGPGGKLSLLELIARIEELGGNQVETIFGPWRPGDQPYYVSDNSLFSSHTGWQPRIGVQEGVCRLYEWLRSACKTETAGAPRPEYAIL